MSTPEIVQELQEEEKSGKLKKNYFENEAFFQNIKVKTEEEKDFIRSNEKFLDEILNGIRDGISVLDMDLNIIKVNHFMEKMYSHKAPIVGKKCYFVYQSRNELCPWCPTVRAIKDKKTCRSTVPYPDNENPQGWIELSSYPLINSSGDVYGIIEYVKDITELKNKEKTLSLLSSVIKQSKNSIAIMDVNGIVEYANPYLLNLINLKSKDIVGKHWSSWLSKSSTLRDKLAEIKESVFKKRGYWIGEVSDRDNEGNVFWRESTIFAIKNPEDKIEHIVYFSKDITDIKKSEENYRNLVELAPVGIITVNKEGVVTSCNPAFLETSGFTKDEIVNKHFLKLPTLNRKIILKNAKLISKVFRGENPFIENHFFEFEWIHKDGSTRLAEGRIKLIKEDEKTIGFLIIVNDITDKKKSEQEIIEAHKLLEQLNKELEIKVSQRTAEIEYLLQQKDEFINQLGHDLKNPLNPLLNLLPIIEKTETDNKSKEMLKVINRNVGYMRNLVTKTIELGKLNSPNTKLHFEKLNLYNEVNKVITNNKYLIDKRHTNIVNNISKDININADILFLEELFNNLINNSLKFTKENGQVTIDAKIGQIFITVSVKDDGIGMNKDQLSHVFDEFYKADISRHDFDSSGLGMPICKRIVERHGGKIWAESKGKRKGSCFYFTVKRYFDGQRRIKDVKFPDRISFITHNGKEILYLNYSHLADSEYDNALGEIVDLITKIEKYDLSLLANVTGNYLSIDHVKNTREVGKILDPFLKKIAIVGVSKTQEVFLRAVKLFSGLKLKPFQDIEEAKDWLVK